MEYNTIYFLFDFVLGCCFGSFLNVCIWRMPRGESVVFAPSHCPKCNHGITWYENIPLISYLALRGRCSSCKEPITIRYFLVELLTGILFGVHFLTLAHRQGDFAELFIGGAVIMLAVTVAFIDVEHRLIPNQLTGSMAVIALVLAAIFPRLWGVDSRVMAAVFSAACGGIFFIILAVFAKICKKLFKKEALGGGDVKLIAVIAMALGWQGAVFTIGVGSFLGLLFALGRFLVRKKYTDTLPFGPFLGLGAYLYLVVGAEIWGILSF